MTRLIRISFDIGSSTVSSLSEFTWAGALRARFTIAFLTLLFTAGAAAQSPSLDAMRIRADGLEFRAAGAG